MKRARLLVTGAVVAATVLVGGCSADESGSGSGGLQAQLYGFTFDPRPARAWASATLCADDADLGAVTVDRTEVITAVGALPGDFEVLVGTVRGLEGGGASGRGRVPRGYHDPADDAVELSLSGCDDEATDPAAAVLVRFPATGGSQVEASQVTIGYRTPDGEQHSLEIRPRWVVCPKGTRAGDGRCR